MPLLVAVLAALTGIGFVAHCPGCIDPTRVNKKCEWTGDVAFRLNPQNPAHEAHLVADAQLAEDLAVRAADAEFLRLYGYEGHGGLIDHHRVVDQCMAQLFGAIERNHAVDAAQIQTARAKRSRTFDLAAALAFVPLFVFGAATVVRRLSHRFAPDERRARLVATALASVGVSAIGLVLVQLWLGVWETIRVRNGHMSLFRAATQHPWPKEHVGALFVGSVAVFWVAAGLWSRFRWRVPLNAAMFSCVMLATMVVAVFIQHAVAYFILLTVAVVAPGFIGAE